MREIKVAVFDDLDFHEKGIRTEACVQLTVGLNGVWKELDLSESNEKEVRDTLERLMAAGSDPEEPVVAPPTRGTNPEKQAYNARLRAWVRETGLKNSSGSGWAYQTNDTLQDYIGKPLIRKYEEYKAAQREGKIHG